MMKIGGDHITVIVVIPIYKSKLTRYEQIALAQCFKVLKNYDICFIQPIKLKNASITEGVEKPVSTVYFDDMYFENIWGYNKLMLSDFFYKQFSRYDYMLVYQLDAFVFSDQLRYWCSQGYDYIGAPWIPYKSTFFTKLFYQLRSFFYVRYDIKRKNGLPAIKKIMDYRVGNGGFSMRKISSFLTCLERFKDKASLYRNNYDMAYHEDIFWSIEVNRKQINIKTPPYKKSAYFAFETRPEKALEITRGKLPFGCHAWDNNIGFWKEHFKRYGYSI